MPARTRTQCQPHFFVFDLETSGLIYNRDRVVEACIIEYSTPSSSQSSEAWPEHFCSLVNPQVTLTAENMAIHNISNEMLTDAPTFREAWASFNEYVERQTPRGRVPLLIAHNADFDAKFLRAELARHDIEVPDWRISCSLKVARKILKQGPHSLSSLASQFDIDNFDAHRATADVLMLCSVLDALEEVRPENTETVGQMLEGGAFALNDKNYEVKDIKRSSPRRSTIPTSAPEEGVGVSAPGRSRPPGSVRMPGQTGAASSTEGNKDRASASSHTRPPAPASSVSVATSSLPQRNVYYVTRTGKCHHVKEDCYGLRKSAEKIMLGRLPSGTTPCRLCCAGTEASQKAMTDWARKRDAEKRRETAVDSSGVGTSSATFFSTESGSKYHRNRECRGLRKAKAVIDNEEIPSGLGPCSLCCM